MQKLKPKTDVSKHFYYNEEELRRPDLKRKHGKTGCAAGGSIISFNFVTFVTELQREHERRVRGG